MEGGTVKQNISVIPTAHPPRTLRVDSSPPTARPGEVSPPASVIGQPEEAGPPFSADLPPSGGDEAAAIVSDGDRHDKVQWEADRTLCKDVDASLQLEELATPLAELLVRRLAASLADTVCSAVASEINALSAQLASLRKELLEQVHQGNLPKRGLFPAPMSPARMQANAFSHQGQHQQHQQQQQQQRQENDKPKHSLSLHDLQSNRDDQILAGLPNVFERMSGSSDQRLAEPCRPRRHERSPSLKDGITHSNSLQVVPSHHQHASSEYEYKCDRSALQHNKETSYVYGDEDSVGDVKVDTWGNVPDLVTEQVFPPTAAEHREARGSAELPGVVAETVVASVGCSYSGPHESRGEENGPSKSLQESMLANMSELTDKFERQKETKIKLHLPVSSLPLWLFGVLPWDLGTSNMHCLCRWSLWYQRACMAVVSAEMVLSVVRVGIIWMGDEAWEGLMLTSSACLLADLPLVVCGPLGLLAVRAHAGSTKLCKCYGLVISCIEKTGFREQWTRQSRRDVCLAVTLWITAVTCRWLTSNAFSDEGGVFYLCAFAVSSGMLMALCLLMLHMCNSLTALVDAFASNALAEAQMSQESYSLQSIRRANEWNAIQATIRQTSCALEYLMGCLQAATISTIVLGAIDGLITCPPAANFAPLAVLLALVAIAFLRAGAVTDSCTRVPPFINTHVSEDDVDFKWQHVVRYIIDSAAGFYIFDVQVTTAVVLKVMYFCGAIVFAVVTQLVSE